MKKDSELEKLEDANKLLTGELIELKSKYREIESRLKVNENDLKFISEENTQLTKRNYQLDSDYHEKQKCVTKLSEKIALLENELENKLRLITKHEAELTTKYNEYQLLESRFHNINIQLKQVSNNYATVTADLNKANSIISKLQQDSRKINQLYKKQVPNFLLFLNEIFRVFTIYKVSLILLF